jgi:hypothetical protein
MRFENQKTPFSHSPVEAARRPLATAGGLLAIVALTAACGTNSSSEAARGNEFEFTLPPTTVGKIVDTQSYITALETPFSLPEKPGNTISFRSDAVQAFELSDGRIVSVGSDTIVGPSLHDTPAPNTPSGKIIAHNFGSCYDPNPKNPTMTVLNQRSSANEIDPLLPRSVTPYEAAAFIKNRVNSYRQNGALDSDAELENLAAQQLESYENNTYEWVGSGFAKGNKVYLFSLVMEKTAEGAWGFANVGTKLRVIDFGLGGCDKYVIENTVDTPAIAEGAGGVMWGAASVYDKKDGFVYLLGNQASTEPLSGHNYYAARVPLTTITDVSAWQYWDGEEFSADSTQRKPVISEEAGIREAVSLTRDPNNDTYSLLYQKPVPYGVTATVYSQSGPEVMSVFAAKPEVLATNLPAKLDGNFAYLPNKQFFTIDGQTLPITTVSVNNINNPAVYSVYSLAGAQNIVP